jgi:hypothetical protein
MTVGMTTAKIAVSLPTDLVDASMALAARERSARVITSDPDVLRNLDPHPDVVAV